MTSQSHLAEGLRPVEAWYRTSSFAAILALTLGVYFLRVTLMPVYGEEPRRAVVAREMLTSGNWIVPRLQGVPQLSRPPLQNWLIAAASWLTGSLDVWAIRLPSLLATLATVVLIYGYAFRQAGKSVAVLSATAYITMYEVLEYGRLGETEAVFTFFVSAALVNWHGGEATRSSPTITWSLCYFLAACGMLTKGLQAPIYFCGAVGLHLAWSRRLRELVCRPHLCGLAVFVACVGAWQLAYIQQMGWRSGWMIYFLNVSHRVVDKSLLETLSHLVAFPVETFAVMLPGSLLLLPTLSPVVRGRLQEQRGVIAFLAISVFWAFLFVWLPPGGRTRYYMPLMPLMAVLMGLIGHAWLSVPWRAWSPTRRRRFVIGSGITAAAIYVGPILSLQAHWCDDIGGQVAALKQKLPPGANLVSLTPLHHSFLYYFAESVPMFAPGQTTADLPAEVEYFAIHTHACEPPPLPFAWEEIAVVSCDRYRRAMPRERIHIGKKIAASADVATINSDRDGW